MHFYPCLKVCIQILGGLYSGRCFRRGIPSGVFWYDLFTSLSSLILSTCPSHLNLPFFISVTMSNSPYNYLTSSSVLAPPVSCYTYRTKYFSQHLPFPNTQISPLNTMLLSHTAPLVLLLFCAFLFLLSWIRLLISTGAILSNKSYLRPLFLILKCYIKCH